MIYSVLELGEETIKIYNSYSKLVLKLTNPMLKFKISIPLE